MRSGNWIPISKALVQALPVDRPYTDLEAMYSLQIDFDADKDITVAGLAKCWSWSRKKVNNFLKRISVKIEYSKNTGKVQNQRGKPVIIPGNNGRGQIKLIDNKDLSWLRDRSDDITNGEGTDKEQIGDRSGTDKGQIQGNDINNLQDEGDRSGTDKEQIGDRSGSTTIDTNTNTNLYSETSIEFRLAKYLLNHILKRRPEYKKSSYKDLQAWSVYTDRMIRLDKHPPKEIKSVIEWCQEDEFWQNNILSTMKLRDQYDQLFMKMETANKKKKRKEEKEEDSLIGVTICRDCKKPPVNGVLTDGRCNVCREED